MANPWDTPPLPTYGDDNEDETFTAVGRVMTQWESIEFELARLYSTFVGKPDDYAARVAADEAKSLTRNEPH